MIKRYPDPIQRGVSPDMEVEDGGDTWNWECDCGNQHQENDVIGTGDELICEECGKKYRCI